MADDEHTSCYGRVQKCPKCTIFERKDKKPPMVSIVATEPLDLVHIDFVKMELNTNPDHPSQGDQNRFGHRRSFYKIRTSPCSP